MRCPARDPQRALSWPYSSHASQRCPTSRSKRWQHRAPRRSTCPVTQPPFWFGTEKLWTILPANGTWQGLPHYTPTTPEYRQKTFWWREGYHWLTEPVPPLKVSGKRLDSRGITFVAKRASNGYREQDWKSFMVVGFDVPTLGCWEITGKYGTDKLTYVIWFSP